MIQNNSQVQQGDGSGGYLQVPAYQHIQAITQPPSYQEITSLTGANCFTITSFTV